MCNVFVTLPASGGWAPLRAAVVLAVSAAAVSGCGTRDVKLMPVAGVVTLDGNPVEGAYVTFRPQSGRPSVGRTEADGRYTLAFTGKVKGALVGLHRVTVTTKQDPDPDTGVEGAPERIPEWYNRRSELEIEVTRDRKPYDLHLTTTKDARK